MSDDRVTSPLGLAGPVSLSSGEKISPERMNISDISDSRK